MASNLLNYITYLCATNIGASLVMASISGYVMGLYNSYHFGRRWVFQEKGQHRASAPLRFAAVYLVGGAGMAGIIEGLDHLFSWDYRLTWFAGAAFALANNFLGSKWFVFDKVNN